MSASDARRRFRYSLRELLLATTAVAAITALYVKSRPHAPTPFILSLDEPAFIKKSAADSGVAVEFGGMGGAGGVPVQYGGPRETSVMITSPTTDVIETKVMPQLRHMLESRLEDSGAVILATSGGGATHLQQLQEFSFQYQIGGTDGKLRVYTFPYPEEQTRLLILVDEW